MSVKNYCYIISYIYIYTYIIYGLPKKFFKLLKRVRPKETYINYQYFPLGINLLVCKVDLFVRANIKLH